MSHSYRPGDVFVVRMRPPETEKNGEHVRTVYGRDAFKNQIGKTIPLVNFGTRKGDVKITSAVVADDGSYADLEYEVV